MTTSEIATALRLPAGPVDLASIETDAAPGFDGKKADGQAALFEMGAELSDLQERLWAQRTVGSERRVLVVLQGMDTSGKGGVLRHTIGLVDPQGVRITSFKAPTEEELAHDFLWRIEKGLPPAGYIGVFDRSHYEDVLIARVRGFAEPDEIERRYGAINDFEARLADEGVSIVKCMLHISADEQKSRLAARLANPEKHWKYNPGDLDERAHWPAYREAYQVALERTSTADRAVARHPVGQEVVPQPRRRPAPARRAARARPAVAAGRLRRRGRDHAPHGGVPGPVTSTGLPLVTVTRYVTPLREGGSLPGVVEGDDLGTYVCKFRGAGQGAKVLVAEVIVSALATRIGLRTPRLVVLDLDPELARYEADEEVQDLLNASVGANLGIDFLPGSFGVDGQVSAADDEGARVLWLDAFTANVDRSWRNPNLLLWHGDLWVIDHGASLYFHHGWSSGVTDPARFAAQPWDPTGHVFETCAGRAVELDDGDLGAAGPGGLHRDPGRGAGRVARAGARRGRCR